MDLQAKFARRVNKVGLMSSNGHNPKIGLSQSPSLDGVMMGIVGGVRWGS